MLRLFPVTVCVRGDTGVSDATIIHELNQHIADALAADGRDPGRFTIRPFDPEKTPSAPRRPRKKKQ